MKKKLAAFAVLLLIFVVSCSKNDDSQEYVPPIVYDPVQVELDQVPYANLSDYRFFVEQMNQLQPNNRVIPFRPSSELFTDYAQKDRFFWIPEGTSMNYVADGDPVNMPVGSVLIKNFSYPTAASGPLVVETRLMIRKADGWIFANYIWNDAQTEAVLDEEGATKDITFTHNGEERTIAYKIPSANQCATCHNQNSQPRPLGFKPQNLKKAIVYGSNDFESVQLDYLSENNWITGLPANVVGTVDYNDATAALDLRVRSYFDVNCAHCHNEAGSAGYTTPKFSFGVTSDFSQMGVCVGAGLQPPGYLHARIIDPQNTAGSTLPFLMTTNNTFYMMPRLGRTVVHDEAIEMIDQWINQLPACE